MHFQRHIRAACTSAGDCKVILSTYNDSVGRYANIAEEHIRAACTTAETVSYPVGCHDLEAMPAFAEHQGCMHHGRRH
jgi:hypothetical protein